MDYTNIMTAISALMEMGSVVLAIVAALTIVTTLIVEVIKGLFPKTPTNFVAVAVSLVISILAMVILCVVLNITVMWYYAVGAVVFGFFVAYAAMFGFDKFKAAFDKLKVYKTQ